MPDTTAQKDSAHTASRLLEIIEQLSEEIGVRDKTAVVCLDTRLEEQLGIDSLARTELLLRIERELSVSLPEQVAISAASPRDLLAHLTDEHKSLHKAAPEVEQRSLGSHLNEAETLIDLLLSYAEHHPDSAHIFLEQEGDSVRTITFGELLLSAKRLAFGLHQRGVKQGETLAIMLPTCEEFFSSFFGTLLAGAIPLAIYPPNRLEQIEQHLLQQIAILKNADVRLLITESRGKSLSPLLKSQLPNLLSVEDAKELLLSDSLAHPANLSRDDIAFLQYTSGSTGSPKGVVLTHANLLANIRSMGTRLEASSSDVFVSWLPLYHDMGLIGAWLGSLAYGAQFVVMSPLLFLVRPARWLRAIEKYKGTISAAPNFAYEICATRLEDKSIEGLDLSSWRAALNGAEPVSPQTLERFSKRFAEYGFCSKALMPVYGLAENCVGLTFPPLGRGPRIDWIKRDSLQRSGRAEKVKPHSADALGIVACGLPIPDHEVRIIDASGRELGEREEGLLQFRGPSATSGYYRNNKATEALLDGEWRNTGDYAYIAKGEIHITGRAKDLIIRAGRNIYPQELEFAVGNLDGVRKGCIAVFSTADEKTGTERLVIAAETRIKDSAALENLRQRIQDASIELLSFPADEVLLLPPKSIPKTSSGKVRRRAARDLFEKGSLGASRAVWLQFLRLAAYSFSPMLRRVFRIASEYAYAWYCYVVFAILSVVGWIAAISLPGLGLRRKTVKHLSRLLISLTNPSVSVKGLERLSNKTPCVVVSNHASYVDSLILTAFFPPHFSYVAKGEFLKNFLVCLPLRRLGAHFVERHDFEKGIEDTKKLEAAVKAGDSVIIFPEGTFFRAPGLLPFRIGGFQIAARAGVPVIPITLFGTRSLLRATQWFPRRSKLGLVVSDPIPPSGNDWSAIIELRDKTRQVILEHCKEPDTLG